MIIHISIGICPCLMRYIQTMTYSHVATKDSFKICLIKSNVFPFGITPLCVCTIILSTSLLPLFCFLHRCDSNHSNPSPPPPPPPLSKSSFPLLSSVMLEQANVAEGKSRKESFSGVKRGEEMQQGVILNMKPSSAALPRARHHLSFKSDKASKLF